MKDKGLESITNEYAGKAAEYRELKDEFDESFYYYNISELKRFLRLEFLYTIYALQKKDPKAFMEQIAKFVKNLNIDEPG